MKLNTAILAFKSVKAVAELAYLMGFQIGKRTKKKRKR